MSDHLALYVDRLIRPAPVDSELSPIEVVPLLPAAGNLDGDSVGLSNSTSNSNADEREEKNECLDGEDDSLIQTAECRICQDEDVIKKLETPCACSGSLKYAHRKCIQHWCNEKGDIICEICHQPYQPDYTAPPPPPRVEETSIDIGGGWTITGTPLSLHDPRLLAFAETERNLLEVEYDEYAASDAGGAAFCRAAALILMILLFLRHAMEVSDSEDDDYVSAFFSIFLLRAAGFLLPCYIMACAISILQRRQRRLEREAVVLGAAQVAFMRTFMRTSNDFPPGHCLTYIGANCITSSFIPPNGFSTETGKSRSPLKPVSISCNLTSTFILRTPRVILHKNAFVFLDLQSHSPYALNIKLDASDFPDPLVERTKNSIKKSSWSRNKNQSRCTKEGPQTIRQIQEVQLMQQKQHKLILKGVSREDMHKKKGKSMAPDPHQVINQPKEEVHFICFDYKRE
ncbi:E3 ubiquitin-protein ligase MARCH4 [Cucurbita argyrosperma subsp. argyrosperma]|nr:E3 ubiquitin-protein ligase MARCH4 [Cucurbita argyrosperma subsp. argyrosperma]